VWKETVIAGFASRKEKAVILSLLGQLVESDIEL